MKFKILGFITIVFLMVIVPLECYQQAYVYNNGTNNQNGQRNQPMYIVIVPNPNYVKPQEKQSVVTEYVRPKPEPMAVSKPAIDYDLPSELPLEYSENIQIDHVPGYSFESNIDFSQLNDLIFETLNNLDNSQTAVLYVTKSDPSEQSFFNWIFAASMALAALVGGVIGAFLMFLKKKEEEPELVRPKSNYKLK